MKLLDKHFGTEIYVVDADTQRYIVKVFPLYFENVDNEGFVTDYLYNHGHKVARLLKSRGGSYVIRVPEFQFTVQEYIEGSTLPVNSQCHMFFTSGIASVTIVPTNLQILRKNTSRLQC